VLTDHLAYYTDQATFAKDPTKTLGVISLNCYFCSKVEGADSNDFQVNAYPKSLVLRAANDEERDAWIEAIMQPLEDMLKPPAQVRICGIWRVVLHTNTSPSDCRYAWSRSRPRKLAALQHLVLLPVALADVYESPLQWRASFGRLGGCCCGSVAAQL